MTPFQTPEFIELCKAHQVKKLYVFGSVARGVEIDTSDVDLLVEVEEEDPIKRVKFLLSLYNEFQTYFSSRVDLLTPNSMKNACIIETITRDILVYCRN